MKRDEAAIKAMKRLNHKGPQIIIYAIAVRPEHQGQKIATALVNCAFALGDRDGVPVTVHHSKGKTVVKVNEGEPAPIAKLFRSIGLFHFKKGREGSVTISTEGTEGKYVIVDSVQFLIVMP